MAIGVSKLTPGGAQRYTNVGAVGTLNGASGAQIGHSVAFYLITTGVDIRSADDADGEAFEAILRALPTTPLAYHTTGTTNGLVHVIMDGTNSESAANIQARIVALGTVGGLDLSSATVTLGTSFVVS